MKAPARLQTLVEEGLIDSVVRQLMSGKEAEVFVVRCGSETRCAKIYKEATQRSFRQAVDYTENRKVKNSRQARAMAKGTRFGRQAQEAAWQSAEVDALYRLASAGVRVPKPYNFFEGVLLMELVTDANGDAAPRLNDVAFSAEQAQIHHATLIGEVVRMLGAGIVHGDLSEFNILLGHEDGAAVPVIIDLPQAHYGPEIWDLYQRGLLGADVSLNGQFTPQAGAVDVRGLIREIDDARAEDAARSLRMQMAS